MVVSIGTQLYRVGRTELIPFRFKEASPQFYWVRNLFGCADGSLLVAGANGAFRINDDRVEHWTTAEGLPDQDVTWINEDDEQTVWIGQVTGLTRIRNHKASVIHFEPLNTSINAIVPDDLGNLWMACNTGVIRVNRRSLNNFADGKASRVDYNLYDGIDALRTIDLTDVESVGCKTVDGKVWLPGPLGAVQIDPAHLPTNPLPPPIYIQKVLVNGILQSGPFAAGVRRGNGELAFQ